MARAGFEVTLLCVKSRTSINLRDHFGVSRDFNVKEIRVVKLPVLRAVTHFINAWILQRKLPTPVIWYARSIYGAAALAISGRPFILELHDIHPKPLARKLVKWLVASESLRLLVVISDILRRDLLEEWPGLQNINITVAHDAADECPKGQQVRIATDSSQLTVGYVGSLYPGKGMEVVEGVAGLMVRDDRFRFEVIGGTDQDLRYWKQRVSIPNVFFHGRVVHSGVPAVMRNLDVALLPNQRRVALQGGKGDIGRWTSPLKLFEYMACGLPIVASDLPVLREVLTHEQNALLCDPEDFEAWKEALEILYMNPSVRVALGNAAQELLKKRYTWRQRVAHVLKSAGVTPA